MVIPVMALLPSYCHPGVGGCRFLLRIASSGASARPQCKHHNLSYRGCQKGPYTSCAFLFVNAFHKHNEALV